MKMKMKSVAVMVTAVILLCGVLPAAGAQTIKLASIAPESSPWGEALNKIAAEWSKISGGRVQLKIYHNGIAGDEANMLRKLKMGQIQGGVFTSLGMMELAPQVMTLSTPLLIRNDAELDYVMERLIPIMNKSIEEKNYVVITWAKAGWVRFFAKDKVVTPADLKKHRLIASPDDPAFSEVFKQLGYDQVPVAITDVLQSLNSGLASALWASPLAVAGFQWFGIANHMTDLKIAPFLGAFIISKGAWLSIPPELRPKLLEASRRITEELDLNSQKLEVYVLTIMKDNGLIVHPVPPAAEKLWEAEFKHAAELLMGKTFSQDVYRQITGWLAEFRGK
ncbi:MAG TPA: C4-dicarboxylate ABC transporter [Spirochaetia bacterium]|nr:C4-dicarboxylate ABC transporter [Spirochaetia bacterium]